MLSDLSLASLGDVGPVALLVLVVLLILTGQLVPGREMRYWRKAFFSEQDMRHDLTDTSKATRDVLRALPEPVEEKT